MQPSSDQFNPIPEIATSERGSADVIESIDKANSIAEIKTFDTEIVKRHETQSEKIARETLNVLGLFDQQEVMTVTPERPQQSIEHYMKDVKYMGVLLKTYRDQDIR